MANAPADTRRLLHELQVHQVELEMQNEELQKTRDEMEAGLEKYSDLYDFAPVGFFTFTPEGVITQVNLTGASLVGLERSRLVGGSFGRLVGNEFRLGFDAFLQQVLAAPSKQSIEVALHVPGVPARFVNIEARRSNGGRECRAAVMDITARKQAETALRWSEVRFRAAVTIATSLIWTNNAQGLMEGEQPGWGQFTGQRQSDYQDFGWAQAVHPDDRQPTINAWKQAVREKRLFVFEHRVRRHDGQWRLCTIRALPLLGEDGLIREWVGVHTDITERKEAEVKMTESEDRYRTLFTSIDEAFCVIEMIYDQRQEPVDYRFLESNPTFEKQTGLHQAVGKRMRELVPDLEAHWFEIYGKVARTGEAIRFVNEAKPMGGRWFDVYACRVGGADSRKVAIIFNDISARLKTEEKIRVSEIRYRRLFEAAHDGVLLLDPGTRKITDANPFMAKLLGYPRDQLVGKELFEIGLLKDESASQEMFRKLKRKHEVRYEDLPLENSDGRNQEVEVVANLYQEGSHPVIQCNIRDITARKQSEAALRRSEERYRSLFNSIDEGFCVLEIIFDGKGRACDYRFIEVNPSFEQQSGIRGGLGKRMLEIAPNAEPFWFELYGQVVLTGKPVRYSNEMKDLGRWFDVYAFRLGGTDSRKVAVLFSDITARKKADAALHASEERFRVLFDLGPVGVYSCDRTGLIHDYNRRAVELWGRKPKLGSSAERFCGSWRMYRPTGVRVPHRNCAMALVLSGAMPEARDLEVLCQRPDGKRTTVIVNIVPLKNDRGEITGAINCFYDITERKRAEVALLEARRKLAHYAGQLEEVVTVRTAQLTATNRRLEASVDSIQKGREEFRVLFLESELMQKKLRQMTRQVLTAQEDERRLISRELHDGVVQTLVGINVELAALGQTDALTSRPLQARIARTQRLVETSVNAVHQFARELRPPVLDDLGLIPALHAYIKILAARKKLKIHLRAFAGVEALDNDRRTVFYRVAQEALTNVGRHARARHVQVSLRKVGNVVRLEIQDDGKSFRVLQALAPKTNQRLGLLGMRERVEMVGGTLVIESASGRGTLVRAEIPFHRGGSK